MKLTIVFARILFLIFSTFFLFAYMLSIPALPKATAMLLSLSIGAAFSGLLLGLDLLFRKYHLRSMNVTIIGLFIGYLLGQALVFIFHSCCSIASSSAILPPQIIEGCKLSLFLFGIYLGMIMTIRASGELYMSIPFVRFTPMHHKKKDLIVDGSALSDARIIDLASSGFLDHHLILPRFILKDLYLQVDSSDEAIASKAKRSLENFKKLQEIQDLEIRYNDTDFAENKDSMSKLIRLARLLDANILTADINRVQIASIEGVKIINLHALSNALKPLMQAGERIKIKIQRYGKEPRQGVGYLEDGTMVVVNGGGDFIGETIDVFVLSVKHTASGRMIFCNSIEEATVTMS